MDKELEELRKSDKDLFDAIRRGAFQRAKAILEDPKIEIPPGQLLAFVARVGSSFDSPAQDEKPQIGTQNILAILPGLPPERAAEIIRVFQKDLDTARKELENGER